jgi:hypothetical protein
VRPTFSISLHSKDIDLLERIQKYFGVGSITVHSKNAFGYSVHSIKNLQVIINHFDKYTLVSVKLTDYLIFRRCLDLIKQKEHLTLKGLKKILVLKSNLNLGLSPVLKEAFRKKTKRRKE